MEGLVYHHQNPHALCITPSSLTYKRGLKRAAEDAEDELQRPSPDIHPAAQTQQQPAQFQQPAPTRVITGMLATIPQNLWYFGATLVNGVVDLFSSRHAPSAQQQAAQQHAATSQPTQITAVATDHTDSKRRAVDTSPAAFDKDSAQAKAAANRAAWYKQYHDPTLANLAKKLELARAQKSTATTQRTTVDNTIPIKDRQISGLIRKAYIAQGTTTAQRAVQKRQAAEQKKKLAEEQAAAEKEAADIAAAEEVARLELEKEKEKALIAAEQEAQRVAAEEEKQRVAAEEEKQRVAAEDALFGPLLEATRITAEEVAAAAEAKLEKRRLQVVSEVFPGELGLYIGDIMENPKGDRQTVIQVAGIPLQGITFRRILASVHSFSEGTDSWLDDDAVNAWYNLIVETKKQQTGYVKSDTNAPAFANLQTAWYAKYLKEKGKGLKRWMKRAGIGGANMLKCFLPINAGNHWTLLIINGVDRSIEYLDSLGGSGTRYFEIARELLKSELGDKYLEKEWTDLKRNRSCPQANMDDCGVFTCMNGLAAAKGRPYKEVTAMHMYDARVMMAAVFFNQSFEDVVVW
jgi:chemotaxis protein histidine kinase CheA